MPWPAIAASAVPALIGLLSQLTGGNKMQQIPSRSPQQEDLINQLLPMIQQGMQNPYEGFEGIENQAREGFNKKTVPGIQERYTAMGVGSGSMPALQALGEAGVGLDTQLGALKSQYGMQRQGMLAGMLPQLLSSGFDTRERQPNPILSGLATGASMGLDQYNKYRQQQQMSDYIQTLKDQLQPGGTGGGFGIPNPTGSNSIIDYLTRGYTPSFSNNKQYKNPYGLNTGFNFNFNGMNRG